MTHTPTRSFNPSRTRIDAADTVATTFLTDPPIPENPVVFGGRRTTHDTIPALGDAVAIADDACPGGAEFSLRSGDQLWHGTGPGALLDAVDDVSGDGWLVHLSRIHLHELMSVYARLEDGVVVDLHVNFLCVCDGYPENKTRLDRWARVFGVDAVTHTNSSPAPALTVEYPRAAGTGHGPPLEPTRHIVDKETEEVVAVLADNPLRNLSQLDGLPADPVSALDTAGANVYALHEGHFADDVTAALRSPTRVLCPLQTPHPVDHGCEYEIGRITTVQLHPLYGGRRVWNLNIEGRARRM